MRVGFGKHRRFSRRGTRLPAVLLALFAIVLPLRAAEPAPAKPLVWIVDGAGDLRGCSTSLLKTFPEEVEFKTFSWSHGYRRIVVDQADYKHARRQGELLAESIQERLKKEPNRRVVLVAHSAGAAVALAAAEKLDKGAIARLVLLAPSVASSYDPAPAAKACKEGMDVFTSAKDIWALGVGVKLIGTTDEQRAGTAAGKYGFNLKQATANIRTHAWAKDDAKLGHNGGHYGAYAPDYAKKHLLPILFGKDVR